MKGSCFLSTPEEHFGVKGFSTEMFIGVILRTFRYDHLLRRLPLPAFVRCSRHHDRKIVDMSAKDISETTIHSPGKCVQRVFMLIYMTT